MISDEAVEAGARASYEQVRPRMVFPTSYDEAPDGLKDTYLEMARAALTAAAPFIAAQALANAVSYAEDQAMAGAYFPEWQNCADKIRTIPNLYRSGT